MGSALVLPEAGDDAAIRHLKRPALLFKKIAVFHLPGLMALLDKASSEADLRLNTELEWLISEGIVFPFATEFFVDTFKRLQTTFRTLFLTQLIMRVPSHTSNSAG